MSAKFKLHDHVFLIPKIWTDYTEYVVMSFEGEIENNGTISYTYLIRPFNSFHFGDFKKVKEDRLKYEENLK